MDSDVMAPHERGLARGLFATAQQVEQAVRLAALATVLFQHLADGARQPNMPRARGNALGLSQPSIV